MKVNVENELADECKLPPKSVIINALKTWIGYSECTCDQNFDRMKMGDCIYCDLNAIKEYIKENT
jgi:hypothetical protein